MPGWRRTVSVAAAMLALVPAAASAQSAGDEQYEDPFGDEQPQAQATPAPTQAPAAEPAQSQTAPAAPAQPAPVAAAPAPAGQLPRTGGDARVPALLGLVLLSAGVALGAHARRRF
jgi:LPXTG-motif cell wall-anchored protein